MARSTWAVYILQSGNNWVFDFNMDVPNNDDGLIFAEISTQQKIKLADGSNAFIRPETFYEKLPLVFEWIEETVSFIEQIRDYQRNGDTLKIVTSYAGREFIGRFIEVKPLWVSGSVGVYDLEATFELMDAVEFSAGGNPVAGDVTELFVFQETPTPATNGVQTVFTVANPYASGTLAVYRNGQLLYRGTDYSETSATTFTLIVAPEAAELLRVNYIKQA